MKSLYLYNRIKILYLSSEALLKLYIIYSFIYKIVNDNSKGEVAPVLFLTEHHTIKAYWWSGGIAPRIFTSALDGDE
jgi:hypothetical protein